MHIFHKYQAFGSTYETYNREVLNTTINLFCTVCGKFSAERIAGYEVPKDLIMEHVKLKYNQDDYYNYR